MSMRDKKLKDITPVALRCGIGACPAILETSSGTYVLIGRCASTGTTAELRDRIGVDEVAIEIPQALLADLRK